MSLRRITRVELLSPHFRERPASAGTPTHAVGDGAPSEAMEMLPLQSIAVDVKLSLCVFNDPSRNAAAASALHRAAALSAGNSLMASATAPYYGQDPSSHLSSSRSHQTPSSGLPSAAQSSLQFTNATIAAPPPMSAAAARYFLADFGEDNVCEAWVRALRTMVLVPFLADTDAESYSHELRQAAVECPHSITRRSMLSSAAPLDKSPVLPPQELVGEVANYSEDYRSVVPDPKQPVGTQVLAGLLDGSIPLPTITFRLNFTVPNVPEGPRLFGVMLTLLNAPAIIHSTPLPLGRLPLGTVVAPAEVSHLLTLSCSSRRIGPNKVLISCRAASRVPRRGASVEEAMHRSLFLTNIYFDTPSSCLGGGQSHGSLAQLPHDPQQRLSATHHAAPLVQALARAIDVTPVRQAGDFFPITLRKHESYNFVFAIELKPEYAYLAHYAAKHCGLAGPPMGSHLLSSPQQQQMQMGNAPPYHLMSPQQQQLYRRTMAHSRGAAGGAGGGAFASGGAVTTAAQQQQQQQKATAAAAAAAPPVVCYGTIGVAAHLHERRLNEMQRLARVRGDQQQRQSVYASYQGGMGGGGGSMAMAAPAPAHQRTSSLFRYRSGGAAGAGGSGAASRQTTAYVSSPLSSAAAGDGDAYGANPSPRTHNPRSVSGDGNDCVFGGRQPSSSAYGLGIPLSRSAGRTGGGPTNGSVLDVSNASSSNAFGSQPSGDGGSGGGANAAVGYSHLSPEDMLLNHLLGEAIETTIVLSYELDNALRPARGAAKGANCAAPRSVNTGTPPPAVGGLLAGGPSAGGSSAPATPSVSALRASAVSASDRDFCVSTATASETATPPPGLADGAGAAVGSTLSLRWQSPVVWSFNARCYDAKGVIRPPGDGYGGGFYGALNSPIGGDQHNISNDGQWVSSPVMM